LSKEVIVTTLANTSFQVIPNLAIDKIREKWGFVISVYADTTQSTVLFLKDVSREIRAIAVDRIPELLDA